MSQTLEMTGQLPVSEVSIESVLLDADLFVKYASPEKAAALLLDALQRSPRSIPLREKMRDICVKQKNLNEAARQCLALVSLYIAREEFDTAYDRLQEATLLDPRSWKPFGVPGDRISPRRGTVRRKRCGPTSRSRGTSATSVFSTRCR